MTEDVKYYELLKIADDLYKLYINNPTDATEDAYLAAEMRVANYAEENEDKIWQ